jgi:integrase
VRFLDAAQIGQIIASANEPFATMFALLGMTGLRAGEMLGLKVADLDFNRTVISAFGGLTHEERAVNEKQRQRE